MLHSRFSEAAGKENMSVIMPAAGYSVFPDHSAKVLILEHLKDSAQLGIRLSDSYGMSPDASICGMVFIHPQARYHEIRHIGKAGFEDYCRRRGLTDEQGRVLLGHLLDQAGEQY